MTVAQTNEWFEQVSVHKSSFTNLESKKIILCPPFTLLQECSELIQKYNLQFNLGAQDISPFDEGAYTGEINGAQIKELAAFVIIGHSERRKNFDEQDEILSKKVSMALKFGLTPIFCIPDRKSVVPQGVTIVAYEPVFAIGTGNPEDPMVADEIGSELKEKGVRTAIYGGSVDGKNVNSFTRMNNIDEVLPGKSSLDPREFSLIIANV